MNLPLFFRALAGAVLAGHLAVSQDFQLVAGGPASGGGVSAGGAFTLLGLAGQTTATPTLSGGKFQLTGGLIGAYVVSGEVTVTLTRTDQGEAVLSWPAKTSGYVLEVASQLGEAAVWQPVSPAPTGNRFLTPFNQPARFFRLRKP